MKVLTLTQPWAALVMLAEKEIETRSWKTDYRGPLAIHAAKGWKRSDKDLACAPRVGNEYFRTSLRKLNPAAHLNGSTNLNQILAQLDEQRGHILATCMLADCVSIESLIHDRCPTWQERAFGDYSPGRWAWILTDIVALPAPIKATGKLGLWEYEVLS